MYELFSAENAREASKKYDKEHSTPRLLAILDEIKKAAFVGETMLKINTYIGTEDKKALEALGYSMKSMGHFGDGNQYVISW